MPRVNVRTFLIDCDGLEIARSDGEEEEGEMPSSVVSTFPAGSRNSGARSFSLLAGIFLSLFLSFLVSKRERKTEDDARDVENDEVGRERSRLSVSRDDTARVSLNLCAMVLGKVARERLSIV